MLVVVVVVVVMLTAAAVMLVQLMDAVLVQARGVTASRLPLSQTQQQCFVTNYSPPVPTKSSPVADGTLSFRGRSQQETSASVNSDNTVTFRGRSQQEAAACANSDFTFMFRGQDSDTIADSSLESVGPYAEFVVSMLVNLSLNCCVTVPAWKLVK